MWPRAYERVRIIMFFSKLINNWMQPRGQIIRVESVTYKSPEHRHFWWFIFWMRCINIKYCSVFWFYYVITITSKLLRNGEWRHETILRSCLSLSLRPKRGSFIPKACRSADFGAWIRMCPSRSSKNVHKTIHPCS